VPTAPLKRGHVLRIRKRSLLALALCASFVGALSLAGSALADSDRPDLENGTGDDPTKPLGKIELLDRYTEAPGPGVAEGTTKSVQTNTPFARIDAPFRLSPQPSSLSQLKPVAEPLRLHRDTRIPQRRHLEEFSLTHQRTQSVDSGIPLLRRPESMPF
jgi:hypothetical protein